MKISIYTFINGVIEILKYIIIAGAIISWVAPHSRNPIVQIIESITDPLLVPGRRLQQRIAPNLPIDFSPFLAFIILDLIKSLLLTVLW
ncbi:YggT family protein [Clostridium thermarum]|uniref:YggT family protein n=1 Tax=Clostridium thermarum TaxID=1716543 RepID=UPI001124027D|nr:YggT family protein [Clostridium thermarum]